MRKQKRDRNREFGFVTYSFVALFLCLMGYIVYFNLFRAEDILSSAYNERQDMYAKDVVRGAILDRDQNVLAETIVNEDGSETRSYPFSDLYAHVVGYSSHGKSGLEAKTNIELLTSNESFLTKIKRDFQDEKNLGDSVVTTLDSNLQQTAFDALGDRRGAVVVIEPSTGKILAMVSKPSFDPNQVDALWQELNTRDDSVLLNRANQGQYAPGSTFKLVTALEYMRENPDYPNYYYECSGAIDHYDLSIACYGHTAHGTVDLGDSIAYSCNTSFCNIGLGLDIGAYENTAEEVLFGKTLPGELKSAKSSFGLTKDASDGDKMMTAMGQGKIQTSPYHMALIAAAIANGGELMTPYLTDYILNSSGSEIEKNMPKSYGALMSVDEAAVLKEYMTRVINYGTATSLGYRSYSVAGKTGTAEYSTDSEKNHSWFIGFTNVDNPDIAISVLIESAEGTGAATDVAGAVFDAYYN